VGHVECIGDMSYVYNILVGKLKGIDNAEDLGIDGMIILE
jgi:hypothetical protein